jgi:hypothetical protein
VVLICVVLPSALGAGKIRVLVIGSVNGNTMLEKLLQEEPLVEPVSVPSKDSAVKGGKEEMMKFIRLYFPRTYEEMTTYDHILLFSPEYHLFTPTQDLWMRDAIREGTGGFNTGSVFSILSDIHISWANSLTQEAFPNDAPAVVARGSGGESPVTIYRVVINREFPDPVLTPYLPLGVEGVVGTVSRYVIPRSGSGTMAYQVGNFPGLEKVPFLVAWDYGEGKTITCGGYIQPKGWLGKENLYTADITMNLIFYSTGRKLIDDVEVFHGIKSTFSEYRNKMDLLVSLRDFIDRFGANTDRIHGEIREVGGMYDRTVAHYMDQEFAAFSGRMTEVFQRFGEAEEVARQVKNSALFWVYVIEWLATTSTIFLSSYAVWSLMVRRRYYRAATSTRFGTT